MAQTLSLQFASKLTGREMHFQIKSKKESRRPNSLPLCVYQLKLLSRYFKFSTVMRLFHRDLAK